MSDVWLTHPQLTPGHDFKCVPAAVGTWMGSGWVPREDQSDPPVVDVPADPRPPVVEPEPAPEPEPELTPAPEFVPDKPVPSPRSPKES